MHSDQINAPRKITRPSDNALMWRWDPNPFGYGFPNQNPSGLGTFTYNLRLPGQLYTGEGGNNDNGFRDYDVNIGRYIQSDPIGLYGGSYSTYAYAGENPISRIDPYGLCGTIKCTGSARVLGGNPNTLGKPGGWSTPRNTLSVASGTAAIIPLQWGGKANLRPYLQDISATLNGQPLFNGITDIVGGTSPIPGVSVSNALMQLNPATLIVELPGGVDQGTVLIDLTVPAALGCPAGTVKK